MESFDHLVVKNFSYPTTCGVYVEGRAPQHTELQNPNAMSDTTVWLEKILAKYTQFSLVFQHRTDPFAITETQVCRQIADTAMRLLLRVHYEGFSTLVRKDVRRFRRHMETDSAL